MTHTDLIRELRALTSAGMSDCKSALEEANWDLPAAVDIIKVKGLNIADARAGRVASEGRVDIWSSHGSDKLKVMAEVNAQTDFVANSQDFGWFVKRTMEVLSLKLGTFQVSDVEAERQAVVALTKENIVVRRWWVEEALHPNVRVFSYLHSNHKIGVLLSLQAPSEAITNDPAFLTLGEELAMQIAAMNPLAVSADRLSPEDVERQRAIFETQLQEMNKPQAAWAKILEGKFRKWQSEVCLLEQESVIVPKSTVAQVIAEVGKKLGGSVCVVNFIRCQVGEGIDKQQDNLAEEVAKMM